MDWRSASLPRGVGRLSLGLHYRLSLNGFHSTSLSHNGAFCPAWVLSFTDSLGILLSFGYRLVACFHSSFTLTQHKYSRFLANCIRPASLVRQPWCGAYAVNARGKASGAGHRLLESRVKASAGVLHGLPGCGAGVRPMRTSPLPLPPQLCLICQLIELRPQVGFSAS